MVGNDWLTMMASSSRNAIRGSTTTEWIATVTAIVALVIAGLSYRASTRAERRTLVEDLLMTVAPRFDGYLTQLIDNPSADGGKIAVFWSVLVANNSERTVSLVEFRVREIRGEEGRQQPTTGRSFDQGLFSSSFVPIDLPITIPSGGAVRFHIKAHLRIEQKSFQIAQKRFRGRHFKPQELFDYLDSRGRTISGVKGKRVDFDNLFNAWTGKGQVAVLNMKTARGTSLQAFLVWPMSVRTLK